MSVWWVLLIILVLALVALAVFFLWLRTQGGQAVRAFYLAVRQMEQDQGVADRYDQPWYLLLGDPALGQRLGRDWDLTPAGPAAWFGRWWADQDAALLAVPQALFLPEEGTPSTLLLWRRLLTLLLRLRPRRPLDAVLWHIPVERLLDANSLAQESLLLRRRFNDLLQRLGLSLPVYVLVSGLEGLPGFAALATTLPEAARERSVGWSSGRRLDNAWDAEALDEGFDSFLQALQASVLEAAVLRGRLDAELYRLPDELEALREGLRPRLDAVFRGNALGEAARLRGVYFSGALQQAESEDWRLSALDAPPPSSVFGQRLWRTRLLGEQGLAQAVPRIVRLRQRSQRIIALSAAALGIFWLAGMLWVWQAGVDDARELRQRIEISQRDAGKAVGDRADEAARLRLQAYWRLLQEAPRWQFRALIYPTSWASSFDADMDDLLHGLTRSEALLPLHRLLAADLEHLREIRSADRRTEVENDSPEQWPNYVAARELASGAVRFEQRSHWYAEIRDGSARNVAETLAQLGNDRLGLNLNPGALREGRHRTAVLAGGFPEAPPAPDPGPRDGPIAQHFRELMQLWLGQYFQAENFARPAGYLRVHLEQLRSGQVSDLPGLEETDALIGTLRDMVELTNAAWSRGNAQELVPGYRNLLDDVRKSQLLGSDMEAALVSDASKLQRAFRDQWIATTGGRDNLLQQQPGGLLALQEQVTALDRAIDVLLRQDFAVTAQRLQEQDSPLDPSTLGRLDAASMASALAYYDSYRKYLAQDQAGVPTEYREALMQSAGRAVVLAMWSSLSQASSSPALVAQHFDVPLEPAEQIRQAFEALGESNLASALESHLTRLASADIGSALGTVAALPLFRNRADIASWDGTRNFGLQLYRSTDVQDLKRSLAQQFDTVLGITEGHAPALAWLKGRNNLAFSVADQVRSFSDMSDEMAKYKAQNPTSSPLLFEQLVSRDFIDMDASTCGDILRTSVLSTSQGELGRQARDLHDQAQARCHELQQRGAAQAWAALADYFNLYLANRFPFAYSAQAEDADPGRVQHFVELLEQNLDAAQKGLALSQSVDRPAAADFLSRLQLARSWLTPLFQRDKAGSLGVDLEVRWRTDRNDERGADQIIAWGLSADDRTLIYPGDSNQRLHWNVGDPMRLSLRWAKDSPQRPGIDGQQPSMLVNELEAGWEYTGPWALLRLMRAHTTLERQPSTDYTDFPVTLQVPVRTLGSRVEDARMYLRLSLMTQGAKQPLSIQPLPVRAPRTPFAGVGLASLAASPVQP